MFLLSYAAFLSGAVVMVADAANGALTGSPGSLFLTFWAYGTAVCLAVTGIGAGLGTIAALATTLTLTIVGNASAGGPVPPPMLNSFFAALHPVVPQGAGLTATRSVLCFDGHDMSTWVIELAV